LDRSKIARLLSGRNHPSRPEKEAMLKEILDRVEEPRRPAWTIRLSWTLAPIAALILALVWVVRDRPATFTARGSPRPSFHLLCSHEGLPVGEEHVTCARGDQIGFAVSTSAQLPFFAALARDSSGTVIWYVPSRESEESIDTRTRSRDGLLELSVDLGPEHGAERYEVYGVFSDKPLSRPQIRQALEAKANDSAWIERRALRLQ
jgi:hypothetical protein